MQTRWFSFLPVSDVLRGFTFSAFSRWLLKCVTSALLLSLAAAQQKSAEEEADTKLQNAVQKPVANLISVPFQDNVNPNIRAVGRIRENPGELPRLHLTLDFAEMGSRICPPPVSALADTILIPLAFWLFRNFPAEAPNAGFNFPMH